MTLPGPPSVAVAWRVAVGGVGLTVRVVDAVTVKGGVKGGVPE